METKIYSTPWVTTVESGVTYHRSKAQVIWNNIPESDKCDLCGVKYADPEIEHPPGVRFNVAICALDFTVFDNDPDLWEVI